MDLQKQTEEYAFPSRSKYQLEKFVIGQHDTLAMQWKQIVLEAQELFYNIKSAEISLKKIEIEISRLLESDDEIDLLEAEKKHLDMLYTKRILNGAKIELKFLEEIAKDIGPHTFEDIEQNQEEYWRLRLQKQAQVDVLSKVEGVSAANILSMIGIGEVNFQDKEQDEIRNVEA